MDKLKLAGQNLGRVFNSRLSCACIDHAIVCITKQPNLKVRTQPKQLLGSLALAFVLPRPSKISLKTQLTKKLFLYQRRTLYLFL